ncbi:MAG: hypothetical protein OJF50_002468 [Nitrospira sp.]|jgi:hypothetical protein|nr:hypothetical protein [Nitrospira sp.]
MSELLPTPSIPDIIHRYVNGESIQVLAAEHAVNRQTIYNWMLSETGPEYDRIITQALIKRICDADEKLENSSDMIGITRAREMARFSRQDFERRRPKLYGPKQEVSVDEKITVIVQRHPTPQHIDVSISSSAEKDEKLNEINVPNV